MKMRRAIVVVVLLTACRCPAGVETKGQAIEEHCPYGNPLLLDEKVTGPLTILQRQGYKLAYSTKLKSPVWVCAEIGPEDIGGDLPRRSFTVDKDLDEMFRVKDSDYADSGYDKGHLVPAAARNRNIFENKETYLYSNAAPQEPGFNRGVWREIEEWVRKVVEDCGRVKVITGLVFYPETLKKIGNGVAVASSWYKIVVTKSQAVAISTMNVPHAVNFDWRKKVYPVDNVEQRTKLNFMPSLSEAQERQLELFPGDPAKMEQCK